VVSLWIRLIGNEWVKEWTLLRTTQCKRGPLVITTAGTYKLKEAIEKPCSDVLAYTLEVCKFIPLDQWVPGCQG
jgi:hypothetical protein